MNQSQKISLLNWMPLPNVHNVSGTWNKCMNLPTDDSKTTYANRRYCGNITFLGSAIEHRRLGSSAFVDLQGRMHYYLRDYQGNNILLVDSAGVVEDKLLLRHMQ